MQFMATTELSDEIERIACSRHTTVAATLRELVAKGIALEKGN
jgi:hypothetical protein